MNSTTIIGIIILAAIVIPLWLLIRSQSLGKRKLQKEMAALGKGKDINISEHESWGNKIIGFDREGAKAAFADFHPVQKRVYIVDLKYYNRCYMEKRILPPASKKAQEVVNGIYLHFVPRDNGHPEEVFPLYNDETDSSLSNELKIGEEWADKFNVVIWNIPAKKV